MSKRDTSTEYFRQMEQEAMTAYREWPIFLIRREQHLLRQLAAANNAKVRPVAQPVLASSSEPAPPNFIEGIADSNFDPTVPVPPTRPLT